MTIYSKFALLGLTAAALASAGTPSAADPLTDQLQLSSGGTTINIADNGAGDVNPLIGTIAYVNAGFNGWEIQLTAGTSSSPDLTPFGLGLTSLTANCTGGPCTTAPLTVAFGDINFAVPVNAGGLATTYSATITGAGTTTQSAYFDNSNAIFDTTNLIGTVGPLGAPTGDGTATGGMVAAVPDYSLTLVQTFADTNGGAVSFSVDGNITMGPDNSLSLVQTSTDINAGIVSLSVDTDVMAVPEPGTLVIFGTALGSLALIRRRKRSYEDPT